MRSSYFTTWILGTILGLLSITLIVLLGLIISASGETTYCYVEKNRAVVCNMEEYMLWAHREWRPDVLIVATSSLQETIAAARALNCPLK